MAPSPCVWTLHQSHSGSTVLLVREHLANVEYVILNQGSARPHGFMSKRELARNYSPVSGIPGVQVPPDFEPSRANLDESP